MLVLGVCQGPVEAQELDDLEAELVRMEAMSKDIEQMLGIYIIHKDKRELLEGVLVKGKRVEVWFLRPLDRNTEDTKCDAFRWLMMGRFGRNGGAPEIFRKYTEIEEITLVFYGVETKVRSDRKGGYIQDRTPVRQLELTIDKERAGALDPKRLGSILSRNRGACISQGEKLVNHHWYIK